MTTVTEAAANIVDIMMGGDRSWRTRLDDSTFLESADWQMAVQYAEAALSAYNDEWVRSADAIVRLQMDAERGRILAAAIAGGDDTGGFDTDELVQMVEVMSSYSTPFSAERIFTAGWMRYDTSKPVDLERCCEDFKRWWGSYADDIGYFKRGGL